MVWHSGMPAQDGHQSLAYSVYRVDAQELVQSGTLCLSPLSSLTWIGFSEEGMLATYDSLVPLQLHELMPRITEDRVQDDPFSSASVFVCLQTKSNCSGSSSY